MANYQPNSFWEEAHVTVPQEGVRLGTGVRSVGGGDTTIEARTLYHLRTLNADRVLRRTQLPAPPKIFELGSGGGFWVNYFRKYSPSTFVGSDLSSTAVDRLSQTFDGFRFVCMEKSESAWQTIRESGPYDLTLAIDVLYHITSDELWSSALNHLCQITAPNGYILIADYFYEQPTDRPSHIHVKHRSMQTYLNVLDGYNFATVSIQPIFYFLNRITSGPWRDHNRILSIVLRQLLSNAPGLAALRLIDSIATLVARPMNARCKTRFLLARRLE